MKFLNLQSLILLCIVIIFIGIFLFSYDNLYKEKRELEKEKIKLEEEKIILTKEKHELANEQERIAFIKLISDKPEYPQFWGDSSLTIISSNRPNGYLVKIFKNNDILLLNLSRKNGINVYIPLEKIPMSIHMQKSLNDIFAGDSIGTYIRDIDIPVEESLGSGWFFMDGNFDGKEELVIEHPGYNRRYFSFFDLEKGDSHTMPGLLLSINHPPFNNIVSGVDSYTNFDRKKKTIYIFEQSGCCDHTEIWAEMTKDYDYEEPHLEVVKRKEIEGWPNMEITTIFRRIDGELKEVEKREKPVGKKQKSK